MVYVVYEYLFYMFLYRIAYMRCRSYNFLFIHRAPIGFWTPDDHLCFLHIFEQYADQKHDKRMLYLDRMMRNLPHKTRSEIVRIILLMKIMEKSLDECMLI